MAAIGSGLGIRRRGMGTTKSTTVDLMPWSVHLHLGFEKFAEGAAEAHLGTRNRVRKSKTIGGTAGLWRI